MKLFSKDKPTSLLMKVFYTMILFAILIVLLSYTLRVKAKLTVSDKILEEKEQTFKALQTQKEQTQKQSDEANSEFGLEKELRNNYGLIKEGEEVIKLVE